MDGKNIGIMLVLVFVFLIFTFHAVDNNQKELETIPSKFTVAEAVYNVSNGEKGVIVRVNKSLKYNKNSKNIEGIVAYQVRFGINLVDAMQEFELMSTGGK